MADVRAGGAYVEIGYKNAGLTAGLASAGASMLDFASKISMVYMAVQDIATQVAKAAISIVAETTKIGSAAVDAANRTGLTAEQVQTLGYVAEQSGSSLGEFENAIKFMQRGLSDAATTGAGPMADALQKMGVNAKDLISLDPQSQFYALADAISKVQDPAERTNIAMDMFSRSGANMIPVLSQGSAGIKAMQDRAYSLGSVLSEKSSNAFEKFGDLVVDLGEAFQGIKNRIAEAFLPILQGIIPQIIEVFKKVQAWVEVHKTEIGVGLQQAWEFVKATLFTVWDVIVSIWEAFSDFVTSVTFSKSPLEAMKKILDLTLFVVKKIADNLTRAINTARTLLALSPIGMISNAIKGKSPGEAVREIWAKGEGANLTPAPATATVASAGEGMSAHTAALKENTEQLKRSLGGDHPPAGGFYPSATTHDVVSRGRAGAARSAKPRG